MCSLSATVSIESQQTSLPDDTDNTDWNLRISDISVIRGEVFAEILSEVEGPSGLHAKLKAPTIVSDSGGPQVMLGL